MAPARPSPQQRSDDVEETDKTDRPSAELEGRDRAPEERQLHRVVGYIGGQVQADERHMEAADKEADCEQPEALRVKCLAQRVLAALRLQRAGRCARRAIPAQP